MKRLHKKGFGMLFLAVVFFIIVVDIVFTPFNLFTVSDDRLIIGSQQYSLLSSTQDIFLQEQELRHSLRFSVQEARTLLLQQAGHVSPSSFQTTPHLFLALYPDNPPSFEKNYEELIRKTFNNLQTIGTFPSQLSFFQEGSTVDMQATRNLRQPLSQPTSSQTIPQSKIQPATTAKYFSSALSSYGYERQINCAAGSCFAEIAQHFIDGFHSLSIHLPYVRNGSTPYSFSDAFLLVQDENSLLYDLPLYPVKPGTTRLTEAGFDSAGWLWWVGTHANVSFFQERNTTTVYISRLLDKPAVCRTCNFDQVIMFEPGDILIFNSSLFSSPQLLLYHGDYQFSASLPERGLVQERLQTVWFKEYDITAIRLSYQDQGYDSLDSFFKNAVPLLSTNMIAPSFACSPDQRLSNTYRTRIQNSAFGSQQSLEESFIQSSVERGIDPALLTAIAMKESSMGAASSNQRANGLGKSFLTGCGWFPKCSSDLSCDHPAVISDKAQLRCSATTFFNAFTEATTGDSSISQGQYFRCNEYANNPEEMWKCILCIYQGNFDRDLGSSGEFFLKDRTCPYARDIETFYCQARSYYDEIGISIDSSSPIQGSLLSSAIEFLPRMVTHHPMNFSEFASFSEKISLLYRECDDNTASCLTENLPDTFSLPTTSSLALSVAEQYLDCLTNNQDLCVCDIHINHSLVPEIDSSVYGFQLTSRGDIIEGLTNLPESRSLQTSQLLHSTAIDFTRNAPFQNPSSSLLFTIADEKVHFFPNPSERNMFIFDSPSLQILKDGDDLQWLLPDERITDPSLLCRSNKNYFPLHADFSFSEEPFLFSLYLDDRQAPEIKSLSLEQTSCLAQELLYVTWTVDSQTDNPYMFGISFEGNTDSFFFYEQSVTELSLINQLEPTIEQLYVSRGSTEDTYSVLLSSTPDGGFFIPGRSYNLSVHVFDHYLNVESKDISSFLFQEVLEPSFFDEDFSFFQNYFSNSNLCMPSDQIFKGRINFDDESLTFQIANRPESRLQELVLDRLDQPVDFLDQEIFELPSTRVPFPDLTPSFTLVPYILPGGTHLRGDLDNAPLYDIRNIPNIICNEETSSVGRICAVNELMARQLIRMSREYFVPNDIELVILQAYRTWEIQNRLYQNHLRGGGNLACNPGTRSNPRHCPHMVSGAIDVTLRDANTGRTTNTNTWENAFCDYGFVRFTSPSYTSWHFEYGTRRWQLAEQRREGGARVCR